MMKRKRTRVGAVMWSHDNSWKVVAVAVIYLVVALVVTGAFVLRSNNVLAAADSTVGSTNVVESQHPSLEQRYARLAFLAVQTVAKEQVSDELVEEAIATADQYLCEEFNKTDGQKAVRVFLRKTRAFDQLRNALRDAKTTEHVRLRLGETI